MQVNCSVVRKNCKWRAAPLLGSIFDIVGEGGNLNTLTNISVISLHVHAIFNRLVQVGVEKLPTPYHGQ